jgi:hypothetical protein
MYSWIKAGTHNHMVARHCLLPPVRRAASARPECPFHAIKPDGDGD